MQDILDEIKFKNNSKTFSFLSFTSSIIALGIVSYLIISIPRHLNATQGIPQPPIILIVGLHTFSIIGLVMTILSLVKKEPPTWFKWIGGVLSVVIFLLIISVIIFARVI